MRSMIQPTTWRLQTRLIVTFGTLTLLLLAVTNSVVIGLASRDLTNRIKSDYQIKADTRAAQITALLADQLRMLQLLSSNSKIATAATESTFSYRSDAGAIQQTLRETEERWTTSSDSLLFLSRLTGSVATELNTYRQLNPDMGDMLLTDAYGGLIASTTRATDYAQADEAWWQAATIDGVGRVSIEQPVFDQASPAGMLLLAVPVRNPADQRLMGVLVGLYQVAALQARLMGYVGPNQPETLLLQGDGTVIASTGLAGANTLAPASVRPAAPPTAAGSAAVFVATTPIRAGVAAIDRLGWSLAVAQNQAVALAPVAAQRRTALLITLGLLVLPLALAWAIGKRLARPLNQLAQHAAEDELAVLAAAPVVGGGDEVERLAQSIQGMAQRVLAARAESEATNRRLETTVHERTATLHTVVAEQQGLLDNQAQLIAQITAMSMPILPVLPGVVVLPIVGAIDVDRAQTLAVRLLEAVTTTHATVILVDLTGLPGVDAQVAQTLLRAIVAVRLLGAQTMLVGIRPAIAQTLVDLGLDLGQVETAASLQEGLLRVEHQRVLKRPA